MRVLKQLAILSSITLAGVFYVSNAANAVTLAERAQTLQIASSLPHDLRLSADYRYQGQHYRYRYSGRYYNHRARKNGHWHYY